MRNNSENCCLRSSLRVSESQRNGLHEISFLCRSLILELSSLFSGAFISLSPTAIASLSPSLDVVGQCIGMCFTVSSLGVLIGSPVSGAILRRTGLYLGSQLLSGSVLLVASALIVSARFAMVGPRILGDIIADCSVDVASWMINLITGVENLQANNQ
jgi:hypothetical protein